MANKRFQTVITVHFGDCDPAGILYFAKIFDYAHKAFEGFIDHCGIGWGNWFKKGTYIVPLRHVESDYLRPLLPGRCYQIQGGVSNLTNSSFEMTYEIFGTSSAAIGDRDFSQPVLHARVKMVHVFASLETKEKIPMPEEVRVKLAPWHTGTLA